MRVYITKYALTQGIWEADAEVCSNVSFDMIRAKIPSCFGLPYFHKGEWFLSLEEAVKRAEQLRQKKLLNLQSQIAKLEALTIKVIQKHEPV